MQAENTNNHIKAVSFGCRLNALEAEKIKELLATIVDTAIVVNTCAVTAEAERQSGQAVRKIVRENPNAPIFVTGCAATRNPKLFSTLANTFVIPNQDKLKPGAYSNALALSSHTIARPSISAFHSATPQLSKQFVQIQNGCNHKCAYCITRLLRGPGVSFTYDQIRTDVERAVQNGFYEIVFTGVDIASYANDGMLISDLCTRILADVSGVRRLRLSSMDPASPEIFKIIDLMHRDARMMPHLHLSMQSGSDTILRAMGRRHNADTVRKIAEYGHDISTSWDIICGFPGETEELFAETLNLARELGPVHIHAFPFSPRPGTVAADLPGQIARTKSKSRVHEITKIADAARAVHMASRIGTIAQVLVENDNIGRTPHDIPVCIAGDKITPRTICDVKITSIDGGMFTGEQIPQK